MEQVTRRRLLTATIGAAAGFAVTPLAQAVPLSPLAEGVSSAERRTMGEFAAHFMAEHEVPGLSVAIARQGRIVYAQGFGIADRETGESTTPSHLFRVGSISKCLTSVAIFTLIEQGRLRLNDKIFGDDGVLKTEYGRKPYSDRVKEITVEHLLTHTAGGWSNRGHDPAFANPRMGLAELISWIVDDVPLETAPGTRFSYSNVGFCLLGRVIEKITGRAYERYVREAVLDRCGITEMRVGGAPAVRASGEVKYVALKDQRDPDTHNIARLDSFGGWIAPASELVSFLMHVDGRFKVPRLLKPGTLIAMTTPSAANLHYAKGLRVRNGDWWHTGHLTGGTCAEMVRTQTGFCWAALCNARPKKESHVADFHNLGLNMIRPVQAWRT